MKIAIVSNGLDGDDWRLQPYRTLLEMGRQLRLRGHTVVLISDGALAARERDEPDELLEMPVLRVPTVRWLRGLSNQELIAAITAEQPDRILWHLSLTSLLHQELHHAFAPRTIGVVTSPIHRPEHILKLGVTKALSNADLAAMHLVGALIPAQVVSRALGAGGLGGLITLSEATRDFLLEKGADPSRVKVVPPGIDEIWLQAPANGAGRAQVRERLGFDEEAFVVGYFGSVAPVRGLHTVVHALRQAVQHWPQLRLLILSRQHPRWAQEVLALQRLVEESGLSDRVRLIDEFLAPEDLLAHMRSSDIVCLPFELVPSDVPLTVLEAMALQRAVVTTDVGSLPELVGANRGFVVSPGDVDDLAEQIEALVRDPAVAAAAGKEARAFVAAERTWPIMGEALQQAVNILGRPHEDINGS